MLALSLIGDGDDETTVQPTVFSGLQPKEYMSVSQYPDWLNGGRLKVILNCHYCGIEFERSGFEYRGGRKKGNKHDFCSKECYRKYRKEKVVALICPGCGKFFEVPQCRLEHGEMVHCSKECYTKTQTNKIKLFCLACGVPFEVSPTDAVRRGGAKYCSRECLYEAKRNRILRHCEYCGDEFYTVPSIIAQGKGRFCSQECVAKWRSENWVGEGHPLWKGGYYQEYGPNWPEQRRKALRRDGHICQNCGKFSPYRAPDVHHIIPFRKFGLERYKEANKLDNLITLCHPCHGKRRGVVIM